jgi:hypothetical protein
VLQGRVVVSGRVVDARTKLAVPRFTIYCQGGVIENIMPGIANEQYAVNDPGGKFELGAVETGATTIVVLAYGYATSFTPLMLENDLPVRDFTIEIQQGAVVEGKVSDRAGNPIAGAWIFSSPPPPVADLKRIGQWDDEEIARLWSGVVAGRSDENGTFTIDTLRGDEPDLYAIHLEHGTGQVALAWSDAPPVRGVNIVLQDSAGAAEVTVTIGGKPAEGLRVFATSPGGHGEPHQNAKTGPDGRATLTDLPEGNVGIIAFFPSEQEFPHRIIVDTAIERGKTVQVAIDYKFGTADLDGVVRLGEELATGGYVEFSLVEGSRREPFKEPLNADGTFKIDGLTSGQALLRVVATFGEVSRVKLIDIRVTEGEHQHLDIDFEGGGSLKGVIYGVSPSPQGVVSALRGEHVIEEITPESMRSLSEFIVGMAHVEPDGSYLIEGITPGRYTLTLSIAAVEGVGAVGNTRVITEFVDVADGETTIVDFDLAE